MRAEGALACVLGEVGLFWANKNSESCRANGYAQHQPKLRKLDFFQRMRIPDGRLKTLDFFGPIRIKLHPSPGFLAEREKDLLQ